MAAAFRLGLTGGIGSGKSTVARGLVQAGAALVDADAIARAVTAPGGAAIDPIATQFGNALITPEGALDREAMRQLVFTDASARERLEAIVHPLVSEQALRQAEAAQAPCVVFDIPLLAESRHWRQRVQRVWVVDCTVDTQVRRVVARSGLSRESVTQIVQAQASRLARLACADAVVWNNTDDLAALHVQLAALVGLNPGFGLSWRPA